MNWAEEIGAQGLMNHLDYPSSGKSWGGELRTAKIKSQDRYRKATTTTDGKKEEN